MRLPLLLHLIATYGYVIVLGLVLAESAGLPLPGETALLIAGATAATGHLWLPGVIAAAALGAILGDTAGYWIGRTYGLGILRRHGKLLRFDETKLKRAEAFFAKHGEKTVFLGRFVPVGRIFSALLAGISRMHYRRFLAWNAAGGMVWATLMGTIGYLFGQHLALIEQLVRQAGVGLLVALVIAVVVRYVVKHRDARHARGLASVPRVLVETLRRFRRWQVACAAGAALTLLAVGSIVVVLLDVV